MNISRDSPKSGVCRSSELLSTLCRLELDYEDSISNFRSVLRALSERGRDARRTLRSLPALPTIDANGLSKLESDIDSALRSLGRADLDALEAQTRAEAAAVDSLERRNARRHAGLEPAEARSTAVRGAAAGRRAEASRASLPPSPPGKAVSMDEVARQIRDLSRSITDRKAQLRQKQKETEGLKQSYLQIRATVQADLDRKTRRIAELQRELERIETLRREIDVVRQSVMRQRADLNAIIRQQEQLERQNFTVTRDKHSNGEAVGRLERLKEAYHENVHTCKAKEVTLKQRESIYKEQKQETERQEKAVREYELKVNDMESRLTKLGACLSGTLGKSQQELEALDMLASLRMSTANGHSLQEELSLLLRDSESAEDDVVPELDFTF
jgi:DNA repair exonuclease SbcCD ATPase subunit